MRDIIREDADRIASRVSFDMLNGKDVLITGASGLVGTYLLHSLAAAQRMGQAAARNVYAVVHKDVPVHLRELESLDNFHFLRGDLSEFSFSEPLPCADCIIHAAGYGQPLRFLERQMEALKINVLAMFSLVKKLRPLGKLVFLSSCSVYTGGGKAPFTESDIGLTNTDHPRICYIEGKRCGEAICNICRSSGMDAKSIRLSFTYGPGVRKGDVRAMYSFIEKAHRGDIHMLDAGAAQRVYLYIADAAELIWKILLLGKEACYNLAGEKEYTIRDVADIVAEHYGVKVIIPCKDAAVAGAVAREEISIERIQDEFPEVEFTSLEDGLLRTMEWYDATYDG